MTESMLAHQSQSVHGLLPIWSHNANDNWCMSGYHAVSVLADAADGKLLNNPEKALDAMVKTSNVDYFEGIGDYKRLGYVPFDKSRVGASTTLEYAYDDWTIYKTALEIGDEETARAYRDRAMNYRNVFNMSSGFSHPRYSDGKYKENFDPMQTSGEGFIEGNSWNFSFHVPHDVAGLIEIMGGDRQFINRLDSLFEMHLPPEMYAENEDVTEDCLIGGYVHGNEPSHHIPYLYAWTSEPWKTQYWIREIMNRMYRDDIRGLSGNDYCGQMSAWYIFSALGFYPVCPGTGEFILGAPYLPYAKVSLPSGKTLEVKADGVSDKRRYVKEVRLNGKKHPRRYLTRDEILGGGVLEFVMSAQPDKKSGTAMSGLPYSLSSL